MLGERFCFIIKIINRKEYKESEKLFLYDALKIAVSHNLQPKSYNLSSCSDERIALFGGTFDPIHLGHLILAETAFEKLKLDQLIFIPAKISPYKKALPPAASSEDRVAMLELAIAGRNNWSVDVRELFREGPSFTIDTVREIQEEHSEAKLFLFIGEDQLPRLSGWKEIEELKKLVSFVVLSRTGLSKDLMSDAAMCNYNFFENTLDRCIDISSTDIRERLAKNKKVDYLLPQTTHDYIKTHHLYEKSDS